MCYTAYNTTSFGATPRKSNVEEILCPINHEFHNNTVKFSARSNSLNYVTLTIVYGVIVTVIGIASNSFVLAASNVKKVSAPYKAFVLIRSLALAEFLFMGLLIGYIAYMTTPALKSPVLYQAFSSLHIFFSCCLQFHNVIISLERAVAVMLPLWHKTHVSIRYLHLSAACVWILSSIFGILSLIRHYFGGLLFRQIIIWLLIVSVFFVPTLAVFVAFSIITWAGLKCLHKSICNRLQYQSNRRTIREFRFVAVTSLMVVPTLFVWDLFFVGTIIEIVTDEELGGMMNWILTFLPFSASALDPVIYIIGTRLLANRARESVVVFFTRKRRIMQQCSSSL